MIRLNVNRLLAATCLLAAAPHLTAADAASATPGVRVATHNSWENSLHLLTDNSSVRAVVVPAIGGRIAHYSVNGKNIIYEAPGSDGKTLANTTTNFSVGGYQLDVGPEIRGIPGHRPLWMGPWQGQALRAYTARVISEPEKALGIQLEKEFVIDADTGDLGITQKMKNISEQEVSFCLWDRTLCIGGGYALIPLKRSGSRFPSKWSIRKTFEGKMYYDGDKPASPKVRVMDNVLVAKAEGESSKIGADSDAGWIAYTKGRLLLIKYFPVTPRGEYTDGGNTVELYWSDKVAELEPLSPEVKLAAGDSYVFPEKWILMEIEDEVNTFEKARALVKRIPPSPFKR
jgi:hypothetical protein